MSNQNNPYGGSGQYAAAKVQFGSSTDATSNKPAGGVDTIKDTATASSPEDVFEECVKQPVVVDFWAPWCGPCKRLAPALEKMVGAAGGRVELVKMNSDDHPSVAGQLAIQSIPAVIA